ncbi:CvpA family protein [Candidatus Woesebacteria bacterium]|nr:CvpA family protein [Candidatus Woesebacteria bacterium]
MTNNFLNGNWVDLVILIILLYFISEAWRVGFWILMADFLTFLGSLLMSLRIYKFTAQLIQTNFELGRSISNALGFLATALILEALLGAISGIVLSKLPEKFVKHKLSKFLALLPAVGEGLVIISFILTLALTLPVKPQVKKDITESRIGGFLIKQTTGVEKKINEIFGGVIEDSLTYLTIHPGSHDKVSISSDVSNLKVDEVSEAELFKLVNSERTQRGIPALTGDSKIVVVARNHAEDMWKRGYFSHYSPEGKDVGDRLSAAHIPYSLAGENLALAPTVQTAHTGLMNSEGHRANILEPRFRKVGIGVIDDGFYGKMFVQVFTD